MLTLDKILDWDLLSGHTVIAGSGAVRDAEVRSITVIDAPDAVNWIKAREFVVTSTYPVQQSPKALIALIEQLATRNAAGLGVKLTRFLREFPDDALRRADELGLPIISLPGSLAWSDLMSKVFADGGEAAHLSAIYRGFSQKRARLGSLRDLFELIAGFVNLPVIVALEDEMGLRVESRGVSGADAEELAETLIHGAATAAQPDNAPLRLSAGTANLVVARTGVTARGGGVVAIVEREQTASEPDLECLRLSVHLLQTLLDANAGPQSQTGGNARLLRDLLDPLLPGGAKELLIARGLPNAESWHVVAGRIFDRGPLDLALLNLRLQQFARRRLSLLSMAEDGSGCTFAIPSTDVRCDEAVLRELRQIFDRQAQRAPGFRYGLGQAGPARVSDAATLLREAEQAMAFGVRLKGFNRLNRHDDLLLVRLLGHPAVIDESREAFMRLLHPLLAMGEQGEMLIGTLRIWFQEDESMPRAAERLGLHVNTVRQRLERCRTVLGLTDMSTDTRLRLYVALQLLPMLNPGHN